MSDALIRPRLDNEPPAVISERGWRYHHLGIPCDLPKPEERHLAHLKFYVAGFASSPYGIEWMRFEPDCKLPELIKTVPHIAFEIDDLDEALKGKDVLLAPSSPSGGVRAAMIVHNGAPVELIEFNAPVHRGKMMRKEE